MEGLPARVSVSVQAAMRGSSWVASPVCPHIWQLSTVATSSSTSSVPPQGLSWGTPVNSWDGISRVPHLLCQLVWPSGFWGAPSLQNQLLSRTLSKDSSQTNIKIKNKKHSQNLLMTLWSDSGEASPRKEPWLSHLVAPSRPRPADSP